MLGRSKKRGRASEPAPKGFHDPSQWSEDTIKARKRASVYFYSIMAMIVPAIILTITVAGWAGYLVLPFVAVLYVLHDIALDQWLDLAKEDINDRRHS